MSCGCVQKRMDMEIERIRRLAKVLAKMENETVAIYRKGDGTYGFETANNEIKNPIVEYMTPY